MPIFTCPGDPLLQKRASEVPIQEISSKFKAFDREGTPVVAEFSGFTARIFQHEVDHLNGIRFPDRVDKEGKLHWVEASEYPEYRKHWETWNCSCSWDLWLAMKEGEPYSPPNKKP